MKKLLKATITLFLFSLGFLGVQDLCRKQTKGFALSKARSSYDLKGDLALSSQELEQVRSILSQPFRFMTKGLQCYVFVSQDDKYVLKLLKWKEIEPPLWTQYVPDPWVEDLKKRKKEKKEHDFTSYRIAFDELKEETGLIYLHMQKTEGLNIPLCLYDPIRIRHLIPADGIEFILQKKAEPFLSYFAKHESDEEIMAPFFSSFVHVIQKRIERHISDSDISLEYNTGICEGKPVLFDIGNLSYLKKSSNPSYETLQKELQIVHSWLEKNSPSLASFLEKKMQETSLGHNPIFLEE